MQMGIGVTRILWSRSSWHWSTSRCFTRDSTLVFAFDNSQNHRAKPPDGLVASRLNLSDGGKNVEHVRPGWYFFEQNLVIHDMQFGDSVHAINGVTQKGIRRILTERGLWPSSGISLKEARLLLSQQTDFLAQQEWLEDGSGLIIFYPKFHPEFNWIEMFWGATKKYTRKHCTYSFKDLEKVIPVALKKTSLATMRRFARKSFRYMDAYREKNGRFLTNRQVEYAMKKYRGHRTVPDTVINGL
uniref:Tc1-like transposase DDE domain-containing protein n=1 Tax=Spongospora subterranea TaxID=70186 RepID=A0A0H5QTQ9_9EUKA|eukprot:CRZ05117.1 hypothetical protein [Spongospora subterranea]